MIRLALKGTFHPMENSEDIHKLDKDIDEAWAQVVRRRVREIERGEATLIPAEEVLEEARKRLSSR
jgi:hypothetical protein